MDLYFWWIYCFYYFTDVCNSNYNQVGKFKKHSYHMSTKKFTISEVKYIFKEIRISQRKSSFL